MEGIRLRTDSDGSTKNAFYQGTIVSDFQHCNVIHHEYNSSPSVFNRDGYPRRKRKTKYQNKNGIPRPFPRRVFTQNSSPKSSNSIDEQYRTITPESLISKTGKDGHQMFDFPSNDNSPDTTTNRQKHLIGTNFLNDDGSRDSGDDLFAELDLESSFVGIDNGYNGVKSPTSDLMQQVSNKTQSSQSYGSINKFSCRKSLSPVPVTPSNDEYDENNEDSTNYSDLIYGIMGNVDILAWLTKDVVYDDDGVPYFEQITNWSVAGLIRWLFYNPTYPEFTSLQQFCWAVVIGVFMGIYTAYWKLLIDACLHFTWRTLPEKLLEWGFFTKLDGRFPLYNYMWMTPGIISGVLTYIINSMAIPIPTQDDWIHSLHSNGVQDSDTFIPTFIVSTIGMTSGLSLGPELPLILTAGMIGSFLGRLCRQSLLQARVLNLTAASAAIGGMFGFPLAGGIFVMELPHRMGLQYFEALSPATIASIVAVLINRMVIKNDVTGMFQYPFLSESLPSYIFKDAIVYGLLGGALGILYTLSVKKIKKCVYHLRDGYGDHSTLTRINDTTPDEMIPIINFSSVSKMKPVETSRTKAYLYFYKLISHAPTKAALTSAILGSIVGAIGMILPHVMFWGEAQLQTMIDGTPLPIFGQGEDPTSDLVALGRCMANANESENPGFTLGCSISIAFAKILVTGLSLSTGIVGGHFWAPLFVGATASQFFFKFATIVSNWCGRSTTLTQYPCVALLCIMGATHVVTCKYFIFLYISVL